MNKKRPAKRFCYRIPTFPREAFIGYLTLSKDGTIVSHYALTTLFTTLVDFQDEAAKIRDDIADTGMNVEDEALLLPVNMKKHVPLKRAYWENTPEQYCEEQRISLFANTLTMPDLFTILVTPLGFHDRMEMFAAAIPLFAGATPAIVEKFMMMSDFPVDETAKRAALYSAGKPVHVNWITGDIMRKAHPTLQTKVH